MYHRKRRYTPQSSPHQKRVRTPRRGQASRIPRPLFSSTPPPNNTHPTKPLRNLPHTTLSDKARQRRNLLMNEIPATPANLHIISTRPQIRVGTPLLITPVRWPTKSSNQFEIHPTFTPKQTTIDNFITQAVKILPVLPPIRRSNTRTHSGARHFSLIVHPRLTI